MRRARPATVAATIGALMMAAGLTPAAGASGDGNGNPPDHAVERHAAATTKAQQARVIDYWTPARMRDAIPRDAKISPKAKGGKPGGGGGAANAVQVPVDSREGKVFFTMGGSNYVCSGTATTSSNADVVTTAGHCLNEAPVPTPPTLRSCRHTRTALAPTAPGPPRRCSPPHSGQTAVTSTTTSASP